MKKVLLFISLLIPIAIICSYYYYDETQSFWSTQCAFYQYIDLQCPGCGGQRAFHYLLHGQILNALQYNLLLVITLPFLLYIYFSLIQAYLFKNTKYVTSSIFSNKFVIITIILFTVFFIIRNIPIYPFIYLSPPI